MPHNRDMAKLAQTQPPVEETAPAAPDMSVDANELLEVQSQRIAQLIRTVDVQNLQIAKLVKQLTPDLTPGL